MYYAFVLPRYPQAAVIASCVTKRDGDECHGRYGVGSVSKRTASDGSRRYVVRWRDPDGDSQELWFTRETDAKRKLTTIEASLLTSEYVDPSLGKITFGEFADEWLRRKRATLRATTCASYASHVARLKAQFGKRQLSSITRADVKGYALEVTATPDEGRAVKATTGQAILRTLKAIMAALKRAIYGLPINWTGSSRLTIGRVYAP